MMRFLLFPLWFIIKIKIEISNRLGIFIEKYLNTNYIKLLGYAFNADIKIGKTVRIGKNIGIHLGKNSRLIIKDGVTIRNNCFIVIKENATLVIKENSYLGPHNEIFVANIVEIGENTLIAQRCLLIDYNHKWDPESGVKRKEFIARPIKIGKFVWVGANCIIVAGAIIKDKLRVGAGTVVRGIYGENIG